VLKQHLPIGRERLTRGLANAVVEREVFDYWVIDFMTKADRTFQLGQRQRITLGFLAQHDGLTARELADGLHLDEPDSVRGWLGPLMELGLVRRTGRTKGTRYYVDPKLMRSLDFPHETTLARIEPHRLEALVIEDLRRHPESSRGEIHGRIGKEISVRQLQRMLKKLKNEGKIASEGERRWTRYRTAREEN